MHRLQWKIDLIDELEEKLHRDPILLPSQIKYVLVFLLVLSLNAVVRKHGCGSKLCIPSCGNPWSVGP